MEELKLEDRFRLRSERFEHAGFAAEVLLPESSEELIDEAEFGADERLPYWAELWPSARALARAILELDAAQLPPVAIELGSGIGLPSLALRSRGVDVLVTDYYEDALLFSRVNARRNNLGPLRTHLLDWRSPHADLPKYPLVIAADVLYEPRNGQALEGLLPRVVEQDGSVLLADPGRLHLGPFLERMAAGGWRVESLGTPREPSPGGAGILLEIQLFRLAPPR